MKKNKIWILLSLFCFLLLGFSGLTMGKGNRLEMVDSGIFQDVQAKKMWRLERSPRLKSYEEVEQYLAELNKSDQYHDWRLPAKQELYGLIAVFDLKDNGEIKADVNGKYWIVDTDGTPTVGSWESGEGCGPSRQFFDARAGYVRAVRP